MRKNKGISLIVLIITIIVIIILATAILVSVISNNPISEANKARYESDRDNMQAVFTNTVGKIMAENLGVVNVTAGQINTETSGVNETTGEVAYTVDNAINEANASGKIVFDKGTNDATTYYTGKKLPIYAAGETIWYVDNEGVLSLEVAGTIYGTGEIPLKSGLYAEDGTFTPWKTLLNNGDLVVNDGKLVGGIDDNRCGGGHVFKGDGKLVIDNSVTTIGSGAFGCYICTFDASDGLTEVIIPNSVINIENLAFSNCDNLTSLNIPNSVVNIGAQAFSDCNNLSSINIPNGITSINNATFYALPSLTQIEIPDSVISIGECAFSGCSGLISIKIPDSITSIKGSAFSSCSGLTSIEIPNGITEISWSLLQGCDNLESVIIPKSVTKIGLAAFGYCDTLNTINYSGTISEWNQIEKNVHNLGSTAGVVMDWNEHCPEITVHCADGDIIIPAWE